ncbi:MAG: uracil-DNA glycosylase [Candidatus Omnitrophica bacterium]|nr:uracil-DNA glycosylase [Candidatus Omnitrophota bacterium]
MSRKEACKWFDACPLKRFYEQGKLDKKWIEDYCWGDYPKCARYKMEKEGTYHADNMMPDGIIDQRLE